ncbi:YhgE/Pip family protein [Virgibacillus sp. 6R]|uniref:YhgE/Pip domain-containing protein n=1 Tax=Metabacillus sp. 22489 TaxID=3453928 RepID=UPI0011A64563
MNRFIRNKLLWIGLGGIALLTTIFTFAFMGSTVNPTPKNLPIAIVTEDAGVTLPNGHKLNISETLVENLKKNDLNEVKWHFISEDAALEAMNDKEIYATILLPEDLSQNIFSLLTETPKAPTASITINEGLNLTGANVAAQVSNGVVANLNAQVQAQLYTQIEEMKIPITVDLAKSLASPITIKTEKINAVAENNANGNTPALFTQLLWITTFFSSMVLYTLLKKSSDGKWTAKTIARQIVAGLVYVSAVSAIILFFATQVLDVTVPHSGALFILLLFIGLCFFFLQNALLNWIGYPAAPLFILLLFFSMPILTIAPEMLPQITKDYLYSWVPFRFSIDQLKDFLFFDKAVFANGIGTLGVIGILSFLVMSLAIFKPTKGKDSAKEKQIATIH